MAVRHWRKRLEWTALVVGTGLLGACIATTREPVGYGGSGYHSSRPVAEDRLEDARLQCLHVARDLKGYRGVRVGSAVPTSPRMARVELHVRGPFGGYEIPCDYDAWRGTAYVH